jgi:iron(III) transport system substrate-binding protein
MNKPFLSFFIMVLALGSPIGSWAQSREANIIEGAKKEGKLVFWGTDQARIMTPVLNMFQKRYPFVQTEYWRGGSEQVVQKELSEARAGRHNFDYSSVDIDTYLETRKAGLMKKYDWPNTRRWDAKYKDSEGYAVARNILQTVIGYNTDLIPPAQVPKNWDDVLDHKWKGAMSQDKEGYDWVLMLWSAWGKEKAINYLKRLAQNNPVFGEGSSARTELLAAGAFKMDLRLNLNQIRERQKKGAPLDWVRTDPILEKGTFMFIAAHAPHPNAAMLFGDWLTSAEGQQIYSDVKGQISPDPTIKGGAADMAAALKGLNRVFVPLEMGKHTNEAEQIFKQIFWK